MTERARFRFFDIEKCGYYLRGENDHPLFSNITDTLINIGDWASSQDMLLNTLTFEPDPDRSIRRSFFVDMHHNTDTGDFFLSMWNEIPNDQGRVFGMLGTQRPGINDMLQTGFNNANAIPGMISYFWFIPELQKFASIKFDHSDHGKTELESYINGYLAFKADYCVIGNDNDDDVYGYSETGGFTENCNNVYPSFSAKTSQNNETRQLLVSNISRINTLIKEQAFDYAVPEDRNIFEIVFNRILPDVPDRMEGVREVKIRMTYNPTLEELNDIIDNYNDRDVTLKRVGFHIQGDKDVYLDGINVIFNYDLEVSRSETQIIDISEIASAISSQRANLLRLYEGNDYP